MLEIEGYAAPSEHDPPSYTQVTKVTGAQTTSPARWPTTTPVAPPTGGTLRRRRGRISASSRPRPRRRGGRRDAVTDIRYARSWFFGKKSPRATQVAVRALGQPEWVIEVIAVL